jgi:hypothetical protein
MMFSAMDSNTWTEITISSGVSTKVDLDDLYRIRGEEWVHYRSHNGHDYVRKRGNGKILLHRLLIDATKGELVDHKNGDTLDNRKKNLRICTTVQNLQNSKLKKNSEQGFKGVEPRGNKWIARIGINGKKKYLGIFSSKEDAARAYDEAAILFFGEFARTNKDLGLL